MYIFFYFHVTAQLSTYYYHQLIDGEILKKQQLQLEQKTSINGGGGEREMREKRFALMDKILNDPRVYKPLIILLFIFLFQQTSGSYILIFYTINIFRNLNASFTQNINENIALLLLGGLRFVVSVIASG
jgi:hypothetical protein